MDKYLVYQQQDGRYVGVVSWRMTDYIDFIEFNLIDFIRFLCYTEAEAWNWIMDMSIE